MDRNKTVTVSSQKRKRFHLISNNLMFGTKFVFVSDIKFFGFFQGKEEQNYSCTNFGWTHITILKQESFILQDQTMRLISLISLHQ